MHQSGSRIVLQTGDPSHQRLVVPDHRSLRIGTLNSILRASSEAPGAEVAGRRGLLDDGAVDRYLSQAQ